MTRNAHPPITDPADVAPAFVARANAGDAEGLAALYAEDAVMAFPPGQTQVGRSAILAVMRELAAADAEFTLEEQPTHRVGDIALTATRAVGDDGPGRVQVLRRQPDGGWLRIIDRAPAGA